MVQYPEIKTSTNITIFNEQISLFWKSSWKCPQMITSFLNRLKDNTTFAYVKKKVKRKPSQKTFFKNVSQGRKDWNSLPHHQAFPREPSTELNPPVNLIPSYPALANPSPRRLCSSLQENTGPGAPPWEECLHCFPQETRSFLIHCIWAISKNLSTIWETWSM